MTKSKNGMVNHGYYLSVGKNFLTLVTIIKGNFLNYFWKGIDCH